MRFNEGDIVRIAKGSRYYTGDQHSSNPKDINGKIIDTQFDDWIDVTWDNGNVNSYEEEDLKLVRRGNAV